MRFVPFRLEEPHLEGGRRTWTTLDEVWVQVRPLRARFEIRAESGRRLVTHRVKLRRHADVQAGLRFRADRRILDVHLVESIGSRGPWLSCMCTESVVPAMSRSDVAR